MLKSGGPRNYDRSVFVFCSEALLGLVRKAVDKTGSFRMESSTRALEAMAYINIRPVALAVVEYPERPPVEDALRVMAFLREKGVPFIVLCHMASMGFEGLNAGAANMLIVQAAPVGKDGAEAERFFIASLSSMINNTVEGNAEGRTLKKELKLPVRRIITIGASTGGSDAVIKILRKMPEDAPPIVAVMHMPPVFTRIYAQRLNDICKISVWEAAEGDRLRRGLALVAPGDRHLKLVKDADGYSVSLIDDAPINNFRPSINLFFDSVAQCAGKAAVGVILTGMGSDGAAGLKHMRDKGCFTVGQDEATSVVYGMPKAAYDMGALSVQAPVERIAAVILEAT